MTYAVSERANATREVQSKFHKIIKQLKRKQNETTLHHKKHHQCVFTYSNYSLFAAHRIWESLYFNHNNFIQNEKTAGTRHLRTLLCTLINLHAAFTSKAVTPVLQRDIAS